MNWIRKHWPDALLTIVSISIVLACVELVLRHTLYAGLLKANIGEPQGYYVPGKAGYDIKPLSATTTHHFADSDYSVWSNNLGCFDTPYNGESPYALLVGDSFAWGYTPFEDKWGTRLESILGRRVIKCGVSGYGTAQELVKAQLELEQIRKPDLLIVAYFGNDIEDDVAYGKSGYRGIAASTTAEEAAVLEKNSKLVAEYCTALVPAHPMIQKAKCFLRRHSMLYLLVQEALKSAAPPGVLEKLGIAAETNLVPLSAADMRAHLKNILAFKELAAKHKLHLLFVLIPTKEAVASLSTTTLQYSPELNLIEADSIAPYLKLHDIDFINPLTDMRNVEHATKTPLYWRFDGHLNPTGNQVLSLLVAKHILLDRGGTATQVAAVEAEFKKQFGAMSGEDN